MSHWYTTNGETKHFIEKAKGDGTRKTTVADARKLNLLPGVTDIISVLDKPALTKWLCEQAVFAVCTAPDIAGEGLDAKIQRVLYDERQQDDESRRARDRGTEIHDAMEKYFMGKQAEIAPDLLPCITPAALAVLALGTVQDCEKILVGDGYAGKCDLIIKTPEGLEVCDFKTTKRLPKAAWPEHRLQGAAYAKCIGESVILTSNLYICTDPAAWGQFTYCPHIEPWQDTYERGFAPLVKVWQWMNNYQPALKEG